jgi:hypothetical protein
MPIFASSYDEFTRKVKVRRVPNNDIKISRIMILDAKLIGQFTHSIFFIINDI